MTIGILTPKTREMSHAPERHHPRRTGRCVASRANRIRDPLGFLPLRLDRPRGNDRAASRRSRAAQGSSSPRLLRSAPLRRSARETRALRVLGAADRVDAARRTKLRACHTPERPSLTGLNASANVCSAPALPGRTDSPWRHPSIRGVAPFFPSASQRSDRARGSWAGAGADCLGEAISALGRPIPEARPRRAAQARLELSSRRK
jgi:hypothetical protein